MKAVPRIGIRIAYMILLICGLYCVSNAQTPTQTPPPEITSDDFPRSRDLVGGLSDDLTKGSVFVFKKPAYKLKRTVPRRKRVAARPAGSNKTVPDKMLPAENKSVEVWSQIGVTIWRLGKDTKPAADGQTARLLVQENGASREYTPQRVEADTKFEMGDRVRLSFESPRAGYLYVIDREVYADGKLGEPYQIFPTRLSRGGENRVQPGQVIDVPGQNDAASFFKLESKDPNWRGELLTVIVSPDPLAEMGVPNGPSPISAKLVETLEEKYLEDSAEYEQDGTAGKNYTKTEKAAGSDGKRQLTQTDPYPQTVYRVKIRPKEPMMINLNLSVK
jgi:hypothetical protein